MNPVVTDSIKLGFIGMGNMGARIARRLLDHGNAVMVYDRHPEKARAVAGPTGAIASSIAELARASDVIFSCLTNDAAVRSVYLGPDGVLASARLGSTVLEMSTVSPATSREVNRVGTERGVNVLDVAISGSTPAAEQGTLTLFAGGAIEIFKAVDPLLRVIAQQSFYLGPSGSGTTMKLVANTLLGVGMQAVAEAVTLGLKSGLDSARLLEVLAKTAVMPPALAGKLERISRGDYSAQFPLELMNKDFRLVLETAAEVKVAMPSTAAAFQMNSAGLAGGGGADFSVVVELMKALAQLHPLQPGSSDEATQPASAAGPELVRKQG